MFERKVAIPGHGEVLLRFKDFTLMPSRISRMFRGRIESQLWQALAWGLEEPSSWPPEPLPDPLAVETPVVDAVEGDEPEPVAAPSKPKPSTAIEDGIFDEVSLREVMKIHNEWQNAAEVTEGE